MSRTKTLFVLFLLLLVHGDLMAQTSSAFQSLWYPRSLASGGLGEQGVVSRDPLDGLQYNPANLARLDGIAASVFVNPWKITAGWLGSGVPLASTKLAVRLGDQGTAGLEYTYWDLGEFDVTGPTSPEPIERFRSYERSIAATYAMFLGEEVSVGAQARYVWQPFPRGKTVNHVLFGAGVSYEPESFNRRVGVGFSLVNFGTSIEYPRVQDPMIEQPVDIVHSDPPPAQMHLGIRGTVVAHEFFDLDLSIGALKPLDMRRDATMGQAQSSFKALFNDWDDFPEDVTGQIGLGFLWRPISLGAGMTFVQEMYLGYFSTGPAALQNNFFTHGVRVGLQAHGVSLMAGYAGRWHNTRVDSYLAWEFPWETFQIDLRSDLSLFGSEGKRAAEPPAPHGIIVTAGYTHGLALGKMDEKVLGESQGPPPYKIVNSFSNKSTWSIEADFYLNEDAALLSSLAYAPMTQNVTFTWRDAVAHEQVLDFPVETVSIESGFRYHPLDGFQPFFVQASLGIIRMNPVQKTAPRYVYQAFDRLVIGSLIPIADLGIVLIPRIGLRTLLLPELTNARHLGGYNQFEFGINGGYRF